MPTPAELPHGPRRRFVEALFEVYRDAGRPTLREIDQQIKADDSMDGAASRETIRRTLSGVAVPARWAVVEAIYLGLCGKVSIDPFAGRYEHDYGSVSLNRYGHVKRLWNDALDDQPTDDEPPPSFADPWNDGAPF